MVAVTINQLLFLPAVGLFLRIPFAAANRRGHSLHFSYTPYFGIARSPDGFYPSAHVRDVGFGDKLFGFAVIAFQMGIDGLVEKLSRIANLPYWLTKAAPWCPEIRVFIRWINILVHGNRLPNGRSSKQVYSNLDTLACFLRSNNSWT